MAEREAAAPTHRVYSVIRRDGQDDYWLNLGLAFPHKDGRGFNVILQAYPLDGKLVCREISEEADAEAAPPARGRQTSPRGQGPRRR